MEIYNVLKRVEKKLASSSEYDMAKQKLDFEMGDLALTCLRNKRAMSIANNSKSNKHANIDLSSIKDKIVNSASSLKNTLENTPGAKTLGYGLAGTGIGSLLGSYLASDKSEDETDEQYKRRKMESAITGGIAGTALGVSAPSILNSIKSFSGLDKKPQGAIPQAIGWSAGKVFNPTTATMAAGAAGGGALNKLLSYAAKDEIAAHVKRMTSNADFIKNNITPPAADEIKNLNKPIQEVIDKLKGKVRIIEDLQQKIVPPVRPGIKSMMEQKLLPTLNKTLPYLNKVLAHSSRGKMLLAGGAAAGLLGKTLFDTSAFNEPALE